MEPAYIIGQLKSHVGEISQISTQLNWRDIWGAIKVRWGIKREKFKVEPGLYAVGRPNENSDVLVTGNYKLSFDTVRKNLDGLSVWLLVLDTRGVNVWCAAGKGTFSTKELVNRINLTSLDKIINHRRIILPQLGATGVSAHELKALTSLTVNNPVVLNAIPDTSQFKKMVSGIKTNRGYTVVYGPVRANDIKAFILNNYKALPEMRKVNYNFTERVKLIPNDFMYGIKHLLIAFLIMFIISSIGNFSLPLQKLILPGLTAILNTFIAYVTGIVITPMLLPFIPFRRFALKGLSISLISSSILFASNKFGNNTLEIVSWYLISGAIASYTAMNFTGSSTYTSLSGVKVEMKLALPVQIASAACGIIMVIVSKLI